MKPINPGNKNNIETHSCTTVSQPITPKKRRNNFSNAEANMKIYKSKNERGNRIEIDRKSL